MGLMRTGWVSPLTELRRELDRLFERALPAEAREEGAVWAPRVDISETEDAYIIRADLPGVKKEDLSITFQDGVLTISGERKVEKKEEKENLVHVERVYGRFVRSFTLPQEVDPDRIEARYEDGVLTITVPKRQESRTKKIEVK